MTRTIAIIQTLSVLILMSLGTVLIKLALSDMSAFTLAWVSVAVAMVALAFYTFVIRRERIPSGLTRQVWIYIVVIGILNFFVGRITLTLSLDLLPATTHTYLTNFIGFITMAMSIFILKEVPTLFQILGAVIAFAGLRVFFDQAPSADEFMGVGLILIGITGVAYTNNIARKLVIITNFTLSNNIISSVALLVGGSFTVLTGIIVDWPPQIIGWQNWGIVLYVGILMIALMMTVWNYVLRTLRSYEASILGASTVIWTALMAIPILGEQLSTNQIIGIGLMLAGLALVQVRLGRLDVLWRRLRPS